jgi:predicted lysophospholipase L1 biosynthesis ABC-type transport system permease subunit
VLGIAAASAIFVGAFTFTGNLDRQLDNHHRYGWNWDQKIGAPGLPDASPVLAPALQHDGGVAGLALGTVTSSRIGNERVDVFAVDQLKGAVWPTIPAGRPPHDANEVVLGARTLRHVGARVGDRVQLTFGGRVATYRVVGRGVFPEFGDAGQLGTGALMTFEGVQRILPTAPRNTYLVQYARPADIAHEQRLVAAAVVPYPTREDARPQDLVDLARGDGLLGFLAIALALLALGVFVHALLTAARSSRHDFAVVRALGMARGQVRSVVGWQAVCVMAGAMLVGVPLGLIGGQLAWRQFATSLGVVPDAVIPPGTVLLTLAGAVVIGLAAALFPAAWAARGRPAPALRAA